MNATQDLTQIAHRWHQLIQSDSLALHPVVALSREERLVWMDLSRNNTKLASVNVTDTLGLEEFINLEYSSQQGIGGIGGYMEDRLLYQRSAVFAGEEQRSLHLGVDIWLPAETPVHAPLAGTVHSFADNAGFGNYGPTIILEHQLEDITFYTLYGHLSRQSLLGLSAGRAIAAGEQLACLGKAEENGDWPPHLHFQIMLDMEGNIGDYPGVAAPSRAAHYHLLCPNPNLLLKIPG
jgi:peptidoglycan LD-endopeptidase LytH